jgi:hypothetical protein
MPFTTRRETLCRVKGIEWEPKVSRLRRRSDSGCSNSNHMIVFTDGQEFRGLRWQ